MADSKAYSRLRQILSDLSRDKKQPLPLIVDELKKTIEIISIVDNLSSRKGIDFNSIFSELQQVSIPLNIFSSKLSSLETISKYCLENLSITATATAKLTKRSTVTIWKAYSSSKRKLPDKFSDNHSGYWLPLSAIADRRFSVLESVVKFLKEDLKLRYCEIARLLHRNDRTVWATYQNAKKKKTSRKA